MTASHFHTHVNDPVAVGRRLKEARLAAGLFAAQLSFPGCSAAYVSRLEAGDRVPSLQLLRKLALKLHVDERYLATGVATVEQAPPELVEAEVALRLGDDELAKERYGVVLEATSAPAARERASRRSPGCAARRTPTISGGRRPGGQTSRRPAPACSGGTHARSRARATRQARRASPATRWRCWTTRTTAPGSARRSRQRPSRVAPWSTVRSGAAASRSRASSSVAATSEASAPHPPSSAQARPKPRRTS